MALKTTVLYKGFEVQYWIITNLTYEKKSNKTFITVDGYKDKPTRDEDMDNYIQDLRATYDADGCLTIEQAYEFIKAGNMNASYLGTDGLSPFENAEDC